ncbi:MAG: hypothetical protein Q9173_001344 [Seirophora scorigena]
MAHRNHGSLEEKGFEAYSKGEQHAHLVAYLLTQRQIYPLHEPSGLFLKLDTLAPIVECSRDYLDSCVEAGALLQEVAERVIELAWNVTYHLNTKLPMPLVMASCSPRGGCVIGSESGLISGGVGGDPRVNWYG